MKKLASVLTLLLSIPTFAQRAGIGTNNPDPSAALEIRAANRGFLPPRVALTATNDLTTVSSPTVGLVVYNTSTLGTGIHAVAPGYYFFTGTTWQRFSSPGNQIGDMQYWNGQTWVPIPPGSNGTQLTLCQGVPQWGPCAAIVSTLNCAGATQNGSLAAGEAASNVSSSIPYTNGNGGVYAAQSIPSTGVTGLTATTQAGTIAAGNGSILYTISGTPATSGTASFALSIGGQSCTLSRTVNSSGSGPLNIETVLIPAGTFTMGSPTTEPQRDSDEVQYQVTLSAFRMSKYEITNAEFAAFLNARAVGSDGLYAAGAYPTQPLIYDCSSDNGLIFTDRWRVPTFKENYPANCVTWYGAQEFATYAGGRLPTEAEWEYACRGGSTSAFSTGACLNNTQANYAWNFPLIGCSNTSTASPDLTVEVTNYSPNAYGLYNMHGNVFEWCADWYGAYPTTAQTNPTGPSSGTFRVMRGGSFAYAARICRSASRERGVPGGLQSGLGFRLAFVP